MHLLDTKLLFLNQLTAVSLFERAVSLARYTGERINRELYAYPRLVSKLLLFTNNSVTKYYFNYYNRHWIIDQVLINVEIYWNEPAGNIAKLVG